MAKKNKIVVNILSRDYTLKSNDSVEHMEKVSGFVKKKINEVKSKNRKLNSSMLAVLTSLNITDEYFKVLEYNKELEKRVENPEYELKLLKNKLNRISSEFEEKNKAYNKIIDEFNALFENSATYENGLNELRNEVDLLREEINKKEKELKKSDKKIENLKDKLKNKDTTIEKTKKELDDFLTEFDKKNSN